MYETSKYYCSCLQKDIDYVVISTTKFYYSFNQNFDHIHFFLHIFNKDVVCFSTPTSTLSITPSTTLVKQGSPNSDEYLILATYSKYLNLWYFISPFIPDYSPGEILEKYYRLQLFE